MSAPSALLPSDLSIGEYTVIVTGPYGSTATGTDAAMDPVGECAEPYSDALACTGFEQGIPYSVWPFNGTAALTESVVHSGDTAMRSSTTEQEGYANLAIAVPAMFEGRLYFRAYYYIPRFNLGGMIKILGFRGGYNEPTDTHEVVMDVDVLDSGILSTYHHDTGSALQTQPGVVPEETWFCLWGYIDIRDFGGELALNIDDGPVLTAGGLDTLPPSGMMGVDLGIAWTQGGELLNELYIDDVVLDDAPVSCQ